MDVASPCDELLCFTCLRLHNEIGGSGRRSTQKVSADSELLGPVIRLNDVYSMNE